MSLIARHVGILSKMSRRPLCSDTYRRIGRHPQNASMVSRRQQEPVRQRKPLILRIRATSVGNPKYYQRLTRTPSKKSSPDFPHGLFFTHEAKRTGVEAGERIVDANRTSAKPA